MAVPSRICPRRMRLYCKRSGGLVAGLAIFASMKRRLWFLFLAIGLVSWDPPAWVEKSNRNAQALIEERARFFPEVAGNGGLSGVDEQIIDLKPESTERQIEAGRRSLKILGTRLDEEQDPLVRQDLEILIGAARDNVRGLELNKKYYIPYSNPAQTIFYGLHGLLDDQVAASRRPAALVRLKRYTGTEAGYTPLTVLAERRTREGMKRPGLLGPARAEVEKDLANTGTFVD